jgi:hypothetical protein
MQQAQGGGFEIQKCETFIGNADPYEILKEENMGLREALKRQTTMVMGEQVPSTERV